MSVQRELDFDLDGSATLSLSVEATRLLQELEHAAPQEREVKQPRPPDAIQAGLALAEPSPYNAAFGDRVVRILVDDWAILEQLIRMDKINRPDHYTGLHHNELVNRLARTLAPDDHHFRSAVSNTHSLTTDQVRYAVRSVEANHHLLPENIRSQLSPAELLYLNAGIPGYKSIVRGNIDIDLPGDLLLANLMNHGLNEVRGSYYGVRAQQDLPFELQITTTVDRVREKYPTPVAPQTRV